MLVGFVASLQTGLSLAKLWRHKQSGKSISKYAVLDEVCAHMGILLCALK